ncbi:hypothetical protein [Paracoccus sp. (in: a-proteobacteria)]|uniref:hypothetical protein n=1 Tax=Paracoccus sp. TaxID=267 RepID=UPI0026DFBEDF|nr:hypothetical protein [Paracoccus sp. (in: a-proteobacteria)]MDO5647456.1 hypothetical protein [Paracoccus sp. (in: a-proteobacteria)]
MLSNINALMINARFRQSATRRQTAPLIQRIRQRITPILKLAKHIGQFGMSHSFTHAAQRQVLFRDISGVVMEWLTKSRVSAQRVLTAGDVP